MIKKPFLFLLSIIAVLGISDSSFADKWQCGRFYSPFIGNHIILASNRLPVVALMGDNGIEIKNSGGGLVSAVKTVGVGMKWTGWAGGLYSHEGRLQVSEQVTNSHPPFDLNAIHFSKKEKIGFYDEFSNRLLWPVLHGLTHLASKQINGWDDYQTVNARFADSLLRQVQSQLKKITPGERVVVLVQDYHLFLVPGLLRKKLEEAGLKDRVSIGFFLHIPFPKAEDFRTIPAPIRKRLMTELLGADRIGFQTENDYAYFRENLQMDQLIHLSDKEIQVDNQRTVESKPFPIGISPDVYLDLAKSDLVQEKVKRLKDEYKGYKVIFGAERLDPIKGVLEKLKAYELFLENNPDYVGKTVLIQVAQPTRQDIQEYRELKDEVSKVVASINSRFTLDGRKPPIVMFNRDFDNVDMVTHYAFADSVMITSLKDGMNLVAFEAIAARMSQPEPGTLILSQNTGAANWLKGAIAVQPTNIFEMSLKIKQALEMSDDDKRIRQETNWQHVRSRTAYQWMVDFMDGL